MKTLAHELIAALAEGDARLPGLGLYACHEHRTPAGQTHPYWKTEWETALRPRLAALGCVLRQKPVFGRMNHRPANPVCPEIRFRTPEKNICNLRLVRISKVKVRRYGSGYHVDRTIDFASRWAQLRMERQLHELGRPDGHPLGADGRLLLFLGFDKAQRPFHAELAALEKSGRRIEPPINFESKNWPDVHGRGFNILAACWFSPIIPNPGSPN